MATRLYLKTAKKRAMKDRDALSFKETLEGR
jgi:hypothetical protein